MTLAISETSYETVTVDRRGAIVERSSHRVRQLIFGLGDEITLTIVAVPGGMFLMGSPKGLGFEDETPQHMVNIVPFLMGQCPITQAQWEVIMGWRPPCRFKGAQKPVENVSWHDAQSFCDRLSARVGRQISLPSESQWEYACRAQTTNPFSFGETITTELANYNGIFTFGDAPAGAYRHMTTEVGQFPANAFGLYDMHGNVWEWCADSWHADYAGAPADGSVWESEAPGIYRVVRGGSWHEPPNLCRSAVRLRLRSNEGDETVGFRVVTSLD